MANWSRGLLQLGEGVGQLAQNVATRERDEAMAARQENLLRFEAELRAKENVAEHGRAKERDVIQHEQRVEEIGIGNVQRLGEIGVEQEGRAKLAGIEHGYAKKIEQMRIDAQKEQWKRGDIENATQRYDGMISAVDERITSLIDKKSEWKTKGEVSDPQGLADMEAEIEALKTQRSLINRDRKSALVRLGDPSIAPVETGPSTGHGTRTAPARTPGAMPKPREVAKTRPPVAAAPRQVAPEGTGGLIGLGRDLGKLASAARRTVAADPSPAVVSAAKQALSKGGTLSETLRKELRAIGPSRLKQHGFSAEDLKKIL